MTKQLSPHRIDPSRRAAPWSAGMLMLAITLSGCANVPLQQGVSLSSYDNLTAQKTTFAKAAVRVDRDAMRNARTVRVVPTEIAPTAAAAIGNASDLRLVANAVDRSLCVALSDRLEVVGASRDADLTVRATITTLVPTDATASGVSTAASLGASVFLPVPVPRLPIGLGGLAVEAEALGADGTQKAAMIWARGANSITNTARMSKVGDAYSLASNFGGDFARLLENGKLGGMPSLPSVQSIRSGLGGRAKYAPCEAFGRAPGIKGIVSDKLGLPPGLSDKGRATDVSS